MPTWGNPADVPSRNKPIEDGYASLPKLRPPPTAVFAPVHPLAELNLLREPLSAAAHAACEHARTLESSGVFNCSRVCLAPGENAPYVERALCTPSNERRWPPESAKNRWSEEGSENQKDGAPNSATITSSLFRVGSVRCLGSLAKGRSKRVGARRFAPFQRLKKTCEAEIFMGSKKSSATVLTNWVISASSIFELVLRQGPSDWDKQGLISSLRCSMLLAKSCGADLEDHKSVFRTFSRVHRSWSFAITAELQNTSISRYRLECCSVHLAPECPRHFSLRPAEARQLRRCDVVHIREPKTRRMTGHATQQHVLLECSGICQPVSKMKSSVPDHRLDTPIWRITAAQHFAYFQRQLRSLRVSRQHYTLHGLKRR